MDSHDTANLFNLIDIEHISVTTLILIHVHVLIKHDIALETIGGGNSDVNPTDSPDTANQFTTPPYLFSPVYSMYSLL